MSRAAAIAARRIHVASGSSPAAPVSSARSAGESGTRAICSRTASASGFRPEPGRRPPRLLRGIALGLGELAGEPLPVFGRWLCASASKNRLCREEFATGLEAAVLEVDGFLRRGKQGQELLSGGDRVRHVDIMAMESNDVKGSPASFFARSASL